MNYIRRCSAYFLFLSCFLLSFGSQASTQGGGIQAHVQQKSLIDQKAVVKKSPRNQSRRLFQSRIVGGVDAPIDVYPWMVSIQDINGHFCGGSLIGAQWILTAAHCVDGITANQLSVAIGVHTLSSVLPAQLKTIQSIHPHPSYDAFTQDNDIALLKLSQSVVDTPLTLPDATVMGQLLVGDLMRVMGWGTLTEGGILSNILQQVDVPLVDFSVCNGVYGNALTANMLCAGQPQGGIDSCQGDSGGPLAVQVNNIWYQTGVVSFGNGCAQPNAYGIYSRVVNYLGWVASIQSGIILDSPAGFGYLPLNAVKTQSVTLSNGSTAAITIASVSVDNLNFTLNSETCTAVPIAAGAQCSMAITVDASVAGVKAATLNVNINGINTPLVSQLTAEILIPIAFVTPPDTLGLTWYGGGDLPWLIDPVILGPDGSSPVLSSDLITDNQKSVIMTELTGPGAFTFNWQSDSEDFYDFLIVYLDGKELNRFSGLTVWAPYALSIPVGSHQITWVYEKDSTVSVGNDVALISQFSWLPGDFVSAQGQLLTADPTLVTSGTQGLSWYQGGDAPWYNDIATLGPDGFSSTLRSGAIFDNQKSVVATKLTGPGTFNFNWQTDSESGVDGIIFFLDNQSNNVVNGSSSWSPVTIDISAGEHILAWVYTKDFSLSIGQDAGWISQLSYSLTDNIPPVITLNGANPLIIAASGTFSEPGFSANDTHGGDLTASVTTNSSVPTPLVEGSYSVIYTVTDSAGNTSSKTRDVIVDGASPVITLTGANPLIIAASGTFTEPGFSVNDTVDGDLSLSVTTNSSVPNPLVEGSYSVIYTVTDTAGNTSSVTRDVIIDGTSPVITLTGANPLIIAASGTFSEPGFSANDTHDGDLTASVTTTNSLVEGSYSVIYTVTDTAGNTSSVIRDVIIDGTSPVITLTGANPLIIAANSTFTEPGFSANDTREGDLTASIIVNNSVPNPAIAGSYNVTYTVSDGVGNSTTVTRIVVVNTLPVINGIPMASVTVGTAYSYNLDASDADMNPLSYSIANAPNWLDLDTTTGVVSGTPSDADIGLHQGVTITVSDGNSSVTVGPFDIEVKAVQTLDGGGTNPVVDNGSSSGGGGLLNALELLFLFMLLLSRRRKI